MAISLLDRFGHWLGCWRGPSRRKGGNPQLMQFELSSHLNGEMIQLDAIMIDLHTGETLTKGVGLWGLGRDGRVSNSMYSSQFGHVLLHEQPDDDDVLSFQGPMPGSKVFSVTFRIVGDTLEFNTRMTEGYDAQHGSPRVTATLKRVTGGVR